MSENTFTAFVARRRHELQNTQEMTEEKFCGRKVILKRGDYKGREGIIDCVSIMDKDVMFLVRIPFLNKPGFLNDKVDSRRFYKIEELEIIL